MDVLIDIESDDQNPYGMYMKIKSENIFKIRLENIE